jgi:hypothetical protein
MVIHWRSIFGQLIVSVGRRELGCAPQGGDDGAACNAMVFGIIMKFDSRPENTTAM